MLSPQFFTPLKIMKLFLLAGVYYAFVSVQILALPTETERIIAREKCMRETDVSPALVDKSLHGEIIDDPKLKKHSKCFYTEIGIMNGNKIDKDHLKEILSILVPGKSDSELNDIVEKCAKEKEDPETTAFELAKCLVREM